MNPAPNPSLDPAETRDYMIRQYPDLIGQCPVLDEMIETGFTVSPQGEKLEMNAAIFPLYANALYNIILKLTPMVLLEVGMAFGVSTLAMLTALKKIDNPKSKLISIDPEAFKGWKGSGRFAVERAGLAARHIMMEDYDYFALPLLLGKKLAIDFAYIDGWHTFDYTLLDFFYIDKMLKVGGVVAFNDCSWAAVEKAMRFVLSHRKYQEINVGLPTIMYEGSPYPNQDRYFMKMEAGEPRWDFFAEF